MKVVTMLFFVKSVLYYLIKQFLIWLRYKGRAQSSHQMTQNAYI